MRDKSNNLTPLERQSEATAIITSGRVWSAVWYLAWPTAINTLVGAAYNFINRAFLGHLANYDTSLAAAGVGGAILMLQFGLLIGLTAGTAALVSRFLGADRPEEAEQATRQSLILAVFAAIVTAVPLALCAGCLAKLILVNHNVAHEVVPLANSYVAIISWTSSIQLFVYMIAITVLRSQGDVLSPLYTGAGVIATNIVFDWLLIFGFGHVPGMGIRGAAYATGISRTVGMVLSLWFIRRSVLGGALSHLRLDISWLRRTLAIGWPASLQNLMMTGASFVFLRILALLPDPHQAKLAIAAYTVAISIEALSFMPGLAYSAAATPLVGQNLGAGKPERAMHSAWVATGQAVAIMGFVGSLFFLIPRYLAAPFMKTPVDLSLLAMIVSYLRINSFSEPFLALNMVLRGALQGAGDTRVPMVITVASMWVVRLPLAWLLAIHLSLGASGAWWAMSLTCCLSGVLMTLWFKFGQWQNTQV